MLHKRLAHRFLLCLCGYTSVGGKNPASAQRFLFSVVLCLAYQHFKQVLRLCDQWGSWSSGGHVRRRLWCSWQRHCFIYLFLTRFSLHFQGHWICHSFHHIYSIVPGVQSLQRPQAKSVEESRRLWPFLLCVEYFSVIILERGGLLFGGTWSSSGTSQHILIIPLQILSHPQWISVCFFLPFKRHQTHSRIQLDDACMYSLCRWHGCSCYFTTAPCPLLLWQHHGNGASF